MAGVRDQQEPLSAWPAHLGSDDPSDQEELDNLWLARKLYDLGAIHFGDFTVGRTTVNSPVYVDLRVLVGHPHTLRYAAQLIAQETSAEQLRRKPTCDPFDIVAGVPYGGLHLATAYSLQNDVPMVYARKRGAHQAVRGNAEQSGAAPSLPEGPSIEGKFSPDARVLVIDDLITTGGSVIETVELLTAAGLRVRDAVVLVDREQGGTERLKERGVRLHSILRLPIMLNLYMSSGMIEETTYRRCIDYLEANRHRRG